MPPLRKNAKNADNLIAVENARVEEAKHLAALKIEEIQEQIRACLNALERVKTGNRPLVARASGTEAAPAVSVAPAASADAVADEISQNLEALVGTAEDHAPKAEPRHPVSDTTISKFTNLQFGRNYQPK